MKGKNLAYFAFIGLSCAVLLLTKPTPDFITISYTSLSSSYCDLLTALGGFSITVLAVLLGLEALDFDKTDKEPVAHSVAVRHVAVSLAVACITCFVGANLMAEVSAQSAGIDRLRGEAATHISLQLEAAGVSRTKIAAVEAEIRQPERADTFFVDPNVAELAAGLAPKSPEVRKAAEGLDQVVVASGRRLFMVASLCAYLASFVILQSLAFLLRIRFPRTAEFTGLQNFAVLGIGALLLIKLVHTASYGLADPAFYGSRVGLILVMGALAATYGTHMRGLIRKLRTTERDLAAFTPLGPYYAVLGTMLASATLLAATFSKYGPPTAVDRIVVIGGAGLCTALLLVIQLEQPTIELLDPESA